MRMRTLVRLALRVVDRVYRRWHRLAPVGPLLFVGRDRYDGPPRRFGDGTVLRTGDPLGVFHFDNARIAALSGTTPIATGLQFRRLLFASLRALAALSARDETYATLAVYRGISWVRHGERIGFLHERARPGWRTWSVFVHVRLLAWAFAPPAGTALNVEKELMLSWVTRRALMERFGGEATGQITTGQRAASRRREGSS